MQPFAQAGEALEIPAMGGAGGAAGDVGYLCEGQPAPEVKRDDFALFRGQRLQGTLGRIGVECALIVAAKPGRL